MKSLVALYARDLSDYAFASLNGGPSAFSRSLTALTRFTDLDRVIVFASSKTDSEAIKCAEKSGARVIYADVSTASALFDRLFAESEGFDHVCLARADTPFLDADFAARLYEKHLRYAAEYTFADGYPAGLAPEILARGILPVLAKLAGSATDRVCATTVFDTIKKDINSFDIETEIAPVDLRQLRVNLACDTKRNFAQCAALEGITAENYPDFVRERQSALRSFPAFYAVQVSGKCPSSCVHCPYPAYCASGKGNSPGIEPSARDDFMDAARFARLAASIAEFSGDAVVSPSLWGECAYHPQIEEIVSSVLRHPSLSLLIETTGLGWKAETLDAIAKAVSSAPARENGQCAINWIVSLDAVGGGMYGALHGFPVDQADARFREALSTVERLMSLFPGCVWPQMVRMKDNEVELESFYRFWKEKAGRVIVQKHDHFCRSVSDRRVADLSPLARLPCWHLKRDMCIMVDGTVPACREDLYATRSCGNAFVDTLESVWAQAGTWYGRQITGSYDGMCGACDEYYTYNF